MPANAHQLVGQRFGKLVVLARAETTNTHGSLWSCKCDCGGTINGLGGSLVRGNLSSCGCLRRGLLAHNRKHGHNSRGAGTTSTYRVWAAMLSRCRNPKATYFADYGGRGITVCDRWSDFQNFLADMGLRPDGLTIDRIRPNGNYEPGNCRWADKKTQRLNQRPRIKHSDLNPLLAAVRAVIAERGACPQQRIDELEQALARFTTNVEADPSSEAITYRLADGSLWIDGRAA